MQEKRCKICSAPINDKHSHAKYCSPACRQKAYRFRKIEGPFTYLAKKMASDLYNQGYVETSDSFQRDRLLKGAKFSGKSQLFDSLMVQYKYYWRLKVFIEQAYLHFEQGVIDKNTGINLYTEYLHQFPLDEISNDGFDQSFIDTMVQIQEKISEIAATSHLSSTIMVDVCNGKEFLPVLSRAYATFCADLQIYSN